jgi:hypothetical protein
MLFICTTEAVQIEAPTEEIAKEMFRDMLRDGDVILEIESLD